MTNDFAQDFATDIVEMFSAGTQVPAAPATVYVTLYDDTGTELNGDLQNGRVGVSTGSGWTKTNTAFENANAIDFGDAAADITVQEFAIKDSDDTDANAVEYFRSDINSAPQDFATGTRVFFPAGDLDVDILD